MSDQIRKIIHIDMDAFYASVEQRDNPHLRSKPIAVGGSSQRGVVAAASYEARKYGVHSAMPSRTAARLCPNIKFVKPRFDVYKEVSNQIRDIFHEFTDLVEPLSLDEAYLDVTSNKKNLPSATLIAKEIKERIFEATSLKASAGVSMNKFLAKIASDEDKPDGLYLIPPEQAVGFVEKLPIEKFYGIGKVTTKKMHSLGIHNGYDLKQWTRQQLASTFGKVGGYFYNIARAQDNRPVNPHRIRKSLGAENTFREDLTNDDEILDQLDRITQTVLGRMQRSNTKGKTLVLKVKYADFTIITRSKTIEKWIEDAEQIQDIYQQLLQDVDRSKPIRLLGLSLSSLNHREKKRVEKGQLTLNF